MCRSRDREVIRAVRKPMKEAAGYVVLSGNLFDSAVMKISVIDKEFRDRFLSNPEGPNVFEGKAIVFEGPEDYHHRIEDPDLGVDEQSVLIIRNCGPVGYPGSAEVVNMQPPAALLKRGHQCAADDGRRAPVRHLRLAVDPQRLARSRRRRRAGAAEDRRQASASTSTPARSTCCCRKANWPPAAPPGRRRNWSTRRRGRRSTAAWSARWARAPAWSRRRCI
jgi:hypothetical protein